MDIDWLEMSKFNWLIKMSAHEGLFDWKDLFEIEPPPKSLEMARSNGKVGHWLKLNLQNQSWNINLVMT